MTFNYIKDANVKKLTFLNYDNHQFSIRIKLNIYKIYISILKKKQGGGVEVVPYQTPPFWNKNGYWKLENI